MNQSSITRKVNALFEAADHTATLAGLSWYGQARAACWSIGQRTGHHVDYVCDVVASLSPRQSWQGNLTSAERYLTGEQTYGFPVWASNLARVAQGKRPVGPKVSTFAANLRGDWDAITLDTWMYRGVYGKDKVTKEEDRMLRQAIRRVAKRNGIRHAQVQAIVWCHVRGKVA